MINKTPTGWTWHLEDNLGPSIEVIPALHDRPAARVSALLGPDGEPLLVPYPRRAIGFDLRPRAGKETT